MVEIVQFISVYKNKVLVEFNLIQEYKEKLFFLNV